MTRSDIQCTVSTLDHDDPRVQAARTAEQNACDQYGLDFSEHFIEIADLATRIRVVDVGERPTVVLIPGREGMGPIWLPLLPELREYTVFVMDRPGSG